jgi:hypothetical protein
VPNSLAFLPAVATGVVCIRDGSLAPRPGTEPLPRADTVADQTVDRYASQQEIAPRREATSEFSADPPLRAPVIRPP